MFHFALTKEANKTTVFVMENLVVGVISVY